MSLEKPTHSPQVQKEDIGETTSREDPLYRILSAEEDSDWEYAFMGAIRKPSTTTAPFLLRGEDSRENLDQDNQSQCLKESSPTYTKLNVLQPVQENGPIEIKPSGTITEIRECYVTVVCDAKPEGFLTIAEDQGAELHPISCTAPGLNNLWSQEFISTSPGSLGIYRNSPNPYSTAPLHIVEGRDDPEDEGICMTSPPPTKFLSPVKTDHKLEVKPKVQCVEALPVRPEEFFEKCDILKWAIDDQDIGEMPGISGGQTPSDIPATVTSTSANTGQFMKPHPTTNLFIQEVKEEVEDTATDSLPLWSPQTTTPTPRCATFEDTHDNAPAAPKRKRGRPSRNEPRDITPKLPRLPHGQNTSDSEYAYVSDSGGLLTDDEVSALKYRRMRDLNNEASKRCRQTRKEKNVSEEVELNGLAERNTKLKAALTKMETQVMELKAKFLAEIRNPSTKIAIARRQMIGSRLGYDSNIIGSLMDTESDQLPDIHSFWSV